MIFHSKGFKATWTPVIGVVIICHNPIYNRLGKPHFETETIVKKSPKLWSVARVIGVKDCKTDLLFGKNMWNPRIEKWHCSTVPVIPATFGACVMLDFYVIYYGIVRSSVSDVQRLVPSCPMHGIHLRVQYFWISLIIPFQTHIHSNRIYGVYHLVMQYVLHIHIYIYICVHYTYIHTYNKYIYIYIHTYIQ